MVNRAADKLRAQLAEEGKVIVCPGVQDGLSARVCLDEGFKTLYMVSASCYKRGEGEKQKEEEKQIQELAG